MSHPAFFHEDTGAVRFWVQIGDGFIGASISRSILHYYYKSHAPDESPLQTYHAHSSDLHAAVRRRVAQGSIEPVMLREFDLREGAD